MAAAASLVFGEPVMLGRAMSTTKPGRLRRWLSLFGFDSAPGTAEETRAFLQRRLSLFFGVMASFGSIFYLVALVLSFSWYPDKLACWFMEPTRLLHLALALSCIACWHYTRARSPRSLVALGNLDAIGSVIMVTAIAGMMTDEPAVLHAESEFVLIMTIALVARAAIVPSTPLRTLVIGGFGMTLLIGTATGISIHDAPAVAAYGFRVTMHGIDMPLVPPPIAIAIVGTTWGIVAVGISTLISRVIYGLQKKIEQVAQLGQYRLDEKIGEGGMGMVYRASHAMLRRPTAIKLLPPQKAGEGALGRFEREVQNTAKLTHPNTVAIYDYGRTPDGIFYYAMEYLDGLDLEKLVALDGPQPPARVIHVLKQVAGALSEAHHAGLIHRDIKPANVILCERGGLADFAKVVDFGLVKDVSQGGAAETTTSGAVITGTPLYMSPESIVSPEKVDGRSDLYAVGAVAYFMLTGAPVFEAPTLLEVCARHLHGDVVPPSKRADRAIDPTFEALILACLAKSPDDRPKTADALHAALDALAVPPWTADQASDWWSDRGARWRARRSGAQPASPFERTVDVDLARRDSAA